MISGKTAVAPSILDLIDSTCELPTIPDVLVKLQAVIDDPESSADEVAEVIALDPAIATNVLRIVNSAYYGLQVRVSSVNLAVSIMGFSMTRSRPRSSRPSASAKEAWSAASTRRPSGGTRSSPAS